MRRIVLVAAVFFLAFAAAGPAGAERIRDLKTVGKWKHLTQYIATNDAEKVLADPAVDAYLKKHAGKYYPWFKKMRNFGSVTNPEMFTLKLLGAGHVEGHKEEVECMVLISWSFGNVMFAFRGKGWAAMFAPFSTSLYYQIPPELLSFVQHEKVWKVIREPPTDIQLDWLQ